MIKTKYRKCSNPSCNSPVFARSLCKYHANLKKLREGDLKALKRTKIKAKNKKTRDRDVEYKKARIEFLETKDHCEVGLDGCLVPYPVYDSSDVLTVHHKRGRIGDLLIDKQYFLACCEWCHRYIEDHPSLAKTMGWSLNRLT